MADFLTCCYIAIMSRILQRFLPSEFGMDPARMGRALEPGKVTFDEKMVVRRAIEEAQIPHTYISANCFGTYFVGNLAQMATLLPPKDNVLLYGDGTVKGNYLILIVNRPRTKLLKIIARF